MRKTWGHHQSPPMARWRWPSTAISRRIAGARHLGRRSPLTEGVTGWAIGSHDDPGAGSHEAADAPSLDQKRGEIIFPPHANRSWR